MTEVMTCAHDALCAVEVERRPDGWWLVSAICNCGLRDNRVLRPRPPYRHQDNASEATRTALIWIRSGSHV